MKQHHRGLAVYQNMSLVMFSRLRDVSVEIVEKILKYLMFVLMGNDNSQHKKIFGEPILKVSEFSYSLGFEI